LAPFFRGQQEQWRHQQAPVAPARFLSEFLVRLRSPTLQQREQTLNSFVRVVAFGEWAGNAFGALAFLWATGVLLGGFCSDLEPLDFWSAMVIIFIEQSE